MCGFFVFYKLADIPENKAFTPNICVPTKKVLFTFGVEIKIELNNISIMRGLHELLTAKIFAIEPSAAAAYRNVVEQNLNGHYPFAMEKTIGRIVNAATMDVIQDVNISTETGLRISYYNDNLNDPFVNVMIIDGPMTRAGDLCSYGSADHRDMIMQNADDPKCVGHLFVVNTPGGAAWTHNDYQQAIDYAHSKKQPVVMWVDGMCASAGMYLASMCDEIWYMHPKDQFGSIGVMAMFYKMGDMDKRYTGETYRELYDPESYNKNEWYRKADGSDGDKIILDDLAQSGVEFRAAIMKRFPKSKEEMIHGNLYDAEKTKGIWTNGQADYGQAFDRVIALAKAAGVPAAADAAAARTTASSSATAHVATSASVHVAANAQAPATAKSNDNSNQHINMEKKYQNVSALLNVEQLAVKTGSEKEIENGSFLNIAQLDTLESAIANIKAESEKQKTDNAAAAKKAQEDFDKKLADAKVNYEAQIAELKSANEKAAAEAKAASDKALADEKSANEKAAADAKAASDKQASELNAKIAEMQKDIDAKAARIAELEQNLKDRDDQIKEMGQSAGKNVEGGKAPVDNGAGAKQVRIAAVQQVYDPSKPYAAQMYDNGKK